MDQNRIRQIKLRPTVLHIITDLQVGGAERSLHSLLAGGLAGQGRQHVLSLSDQDGFGPRIAALGVTVHTLGLRRDRQLPGAIAELQRLVRRIRPDLVQGWMYHGNLVAQIAQLLAIGKPALVWNIRQSLDYFAREKRGTRMAIRFGRHLSGGANTILYNSTRARAQHEAFGYNATRSQVIPNGFDTSLWRPDETARAVMRARLGLDTADILIGFIGRFHAKKDLPNLLIALAPLMAADRRLHLAIIGRGNGRDNPVLTPHYASMPVDRLHVLGQRDAVHALLPGFDIFAMSSASEGFPNVLGEAMASGLPCIATDVGDSAQVLGETGMIVPPSNPEALRQALRDMIALDAKGRRAQGAKARARIAGTFSLNATVRAYSNLYDRLGRKLISD